MFELAKRCRERYFPYYYEEEDEPEGELDIAEEVEEEEVVDEQ